MKCAICGKKKKLLGYYINDKCKKCFKLTKSSNLSVLATISTLKYCVKDYRNCHGWVRIGVEKGYEIYKCSRCGLSKKEKLVFIKI